jgi:hypothetical protein
MSVELPEAVIVATQMRDLVAGKRVQGWEVREAARLSPCA